MRADVHSSTVRSIAAVLRPSAPSRPDVPATAFPISEAEASFRNAIDDIYRVYVRGNTGAMVPIRAQLAILRRKGRR